MTGSDRHAGAKAVLGKPQLHLIFWLCAMTEAPAMGQSAAELMARYKGLTGVEPARSCAGPQDPDDVLVCGRRGDDRYRLPPESRGAGPRGADARGEREALLRPGSRCDGTGVGARGDAGCTGGLNVVAIGAAIVKGVGGLVGE
ncbi:hypothetical protein ACFSGX_03600 [Sphingomonas arantia]|uniref:Uncharacterized protein n=1 Tax=Sphingomonas arantia TaxID=1460676 RepID=A0ABW4TX91_9SPHN